jgi:hypothetical protein
MSWKRALRFGLGALGAPLYPFLVLQLFYESSFRPWSPGLVLLAATATVPLVMSTRALSPSTQGDSLAYRPIRIAHLTCALAGSCVLSIHGLIATAEPSLTSAVLRLTPIAMFLCLLVGPSLVSLVHFDVQQAMGVPPKQRVMHIGGLAAALMAASFVASLASLPTAHWAATAAELVDPRSTSILMHLAD